MSQESLEVLAQKRSVIKRKIANLIKKVMPLVQKIESSQFDIVCAEQYLKELRDLDSQFQEIYLLANAQMGFTICTAVHVVTSSGPIAKSNFERCNQVDFCFLFARRLA